MTSKKVGKIGASLDTLAQVATSTDKEGIQEEIDFDSSTDIQDKKALLKRARRKLFTSKLVLKLVDASKKNEDSILRKSYWNTYHCASELELCSDGKVRGHYCKNRWCLVCNSIRTAQLINKYQPIIDSWDEKYLVTLTIPNCSGSELLNTLNKMSKYATQIRRTLNKQYERGRSAKLVGLRKLECTYNATRNDYHPHYHFMVTDKDCAECLITMWLAKSSQSVLAAQDIRKADSRSSKELFKYFTKLISNTTKSAKKNKIYADAQDIIFNAFRRKRVFQPLGFKLSKSDTSEDIAVSDVIAIAYWDTDFHDWFRSDSGEALTGYTPSDEFQKFLNESIIVRK